MISRLSPFLATARQKRPKGDQDKGHRREVELTVEAMKQGKEAPIPFAELIEVTEATFAIEEAIRTQRMVSLDAGTGYPRENQPTSGERSRGVDNLKLTVEQTHLRADVIMEFFRNPDALSFGPPRTIGRCTGCLSYFRWCRSASCSRWRL